ncbi:calcium-dependent protein kinase 32-like [Dorcoceras hygrometricum]|uniref:Calcium-dependent protein kinase 32-like n=1 Tax=Dorcoceras hygrometricum TaxID=472368 RepID=A0A2Z7AJ46_9LAMI|nr:calcium-dependent protein kinase 32-like [Dorcoceras hygrometricum]
MTSSQSAVSYSDQQLSKSYQQISREAQEMKRRRRRRFQSQVTVDEAVVIEIISNVDKSVDSRYSRSCWQLMSNVEQEADNSKRNSEESDVVEEESSRKLFRKLKYQSQRSRRNDDFSSSAKTEDQPSRKLQRFVYPVEMESSRKKADVVESYNPDARYPVAVFEASAVAQRIQRNQCSRWKN